MKKNLCVFIFAAVLAGQASPYDIPNPPVVKVESGYVMGFMNGSTFSFLGIPYAQAKRFEPPQKVPACEGVKAAQIYGPICPVMKTNFVSVGGTNFTWPIHP